VIIFLILDFFVLNIILNKEKTTDSAAKTTDPTTDTTKTDDKTTDTDDGTTYELENITEEERKEFVTWTNIYRCMHGSPALKWN